jgi:hypothetical protein
MDGAWNVMRSEEVRLRRKYCMGMKVQYAGQGVSTINEGIYLPMHMGRRVSFSAFLFVRVGAIKQRGLAECILRSCFRIVPISCPYFQNCL